MPFVEVWHVDGVTRLAQLGREGFHSLGPPMSVVVQHKLGHGPLAFEGLMIQIYRTIRDDSLIQPCRAIPQSRTTTSPTGSSSPLQGRYGRSAIPCARPSSACCTSGQRP